MDWLSLTQVKELGVMVKDCTTIGTDLSRIFEQWWTWAKLSAQPSFPATTAFDNRFQTTRQLPCWSTVVPKSPTKGTGRCPNPLSYAPTTATRYNKYNQMDIKFANTHHRKSKSGESALVGGTYIASAPDELNGVSDEDCPVPVYAKLDGSDSSNSSSVGGKSSSSDGGLSCVLPGDRVKRAWDQDALVDTILGASRNGTVSLSVMDFLPASQFKPPEDVMWWPALSNALATAANTKGVRVRMLISLWNQTSERMLPYLQGLQTQAGACQAMPSDPAEYDPCPGSLDIRYFAVSGWNESQYMPYSRVNHAKYIVTDNRVNIGTSNMVWGYFYSTAGMSFNSGDPGLVKGAQDIFDRDWNSEYSIPLPSA